jgi:hypothetical protein
MHRRVLAFCLLVAVLALNVRGEEKAADDKGFEPLFPRDSLDGWREGYWNDLSRSPTGNAPRWTLVDGVLRAEDTATWVYSEEEFGDFTLRFEGKVEEGANSGIGLRFPIEKDPAYDGLEVQFVDADAPAHKDLTPNQKTGSVYGEIEAKPADRPAGEWNKFEITIKGRRLAVVINGEKVLDADLAEHTEDRPRGKPLAERPLKGRIGFQNIHGTASYRNLSIKRLD